MQSIIATTTLASFMMKIEALDFERAVARIREKRRFVSPNSGFERQLRAYQFVTVNDEEQRANFDKFTAKDAPFVELVRYSRKLQIDDPAQVHPFLEEVIKFQSPAVADSGAETTSATATSVRTPADNGAVEWIGDTEPVDDYGAAEVDVGDGEADAEAA